jgi:hypothetical protein
LNGLIVNIQRGYFLFLLFILLSKQLGGLHRVVAASNNYPLLEEFFPSFDQVSFSASVQGAQQNWLHLADGCLAKDGRGAPIHLGVLLPSMHC